MRSVFGGTLFLSFIVFSFVITGCSGPTSENDTTLSINLGKDSLPDKASVSIDQLRHVIVLSGPGGRQTYTISGGGTVKATVAAGLWYIDVEAFLGDELYAKGSGSAEVKAGRNTSVTIFMAVVWAGLAEGGGGGGGSGGNPDALGGIVSLTGDNWEGAVLAANILGLTNVKGSTINYTWIADGAEITSALNAPSYQVTGGERGRGITVKVSTDGNSNAVTSNKIDIRTDFAVNDVASLNLIRADLSGAYILTGDVNIPAGFMPIGGASDGGAFTGTFDGNGHTVDLGYNYVQLDGSEAGLFGGINGGTVKNLNLEGEITVAAPASCWVGALAGGFNEGTIRNVSSSVNVTITGGIDSSWAGGIVGATGLNGPAIIINCYSTGDVTVTGYQPTGNHNFFAGGIVGNYDITIQSCWASGDIGAIGPAAQGCMAGGIAGAINYWAGVQAPVITGCVALNGDISAGPGTSTAGRISGENTGLSNNHAVVSMLVNSAPVGSGLANDIDGANFPSSALKSDWQSIGWTVWDNKDDASEGSPWVWDDRVGSLTQDRPVLWFELP